MPTQLELIISAIERNGPMTAEELAAVLKENGSNAERPENTVLSLVHKCRDVVNLGGSPSRYGLRERLNGKEVCLDCLDDLTALETFCKKIRSAVKSCRTEADAREKLVVPFLRDFLGYSVVDDMEFERPINDEKRERPDIVVVKGRKRLFFVEIKALGTDLSSSETQLKRYFRMMDRPPVNFGILTDGIRWRFYIRSVRSGIPDAVLFNEGSVDCPDMRFLDSITEFRKDLFNNDALKNMAQQQVAGLPELTKKA